MISARCAAWKRGTRKRRVGSAERWVLSSRLLALCPLSSHSHPKRRWYVRARFLLPLPENTSLTHPPPPNIFTSSHLHQVYTLVHLFFSESYSAFSTRSSTASSSSTHLPLPPSRPFLDMCYKPRRTPLLRFARESGWADIGGVEAMVEQGLAQARMWAASAQVLSLSLSGDAATEGEGLEFDAPQWATKAGDDGPLGAGIEQRAREMVSAMTDIVTPASVPAPAPAPAPAQRIAQAQQQLVAA